MTADKLIDVLERLSPLQYAESWDNPGLICGERSKEIDSVLIAVDATDAVVDEAIAKKVDMIITHHPLIFKGIKSVSDDNFIGRRLLKLIKNDICLYAMHTNFDVKGMADEAAKMLGLTNTSVLEITYRDGIEVEGIGRTGLLPNKMSLLECAELVKKVYDIKNVKVFGNLKHKVQIVSVSPGSGKGMSANALRVNADVLITGDIDHHEGIDAVAQGLMVIDAGHYGIEKLFVKYIEGYIKEKAKDIKVIKAKEKEPFTVI